MPNSFKHSTDAQTLALKKGNFYIGTGDVDKGPTSNTGYWNGITPPAGGYTIYLNKVSGGPSIYVASNDSQLIDITNKIAGTSNTTTSQCLSYYREQTDKVVLNSDFGPIITNGLVLFLDSGSVSSYPKTSSIWYDLSSNSRTVNNCTFENGSNGRSSLSSNGNDSDIATSNLLNNDVHTIEFMLKFKSNGSYPNGWTGGWEQFFGYYSGGSDRSPGIWRYPSARLIHWRYNPDNSGIDFGKNSSFEEFNLNTYYLVAVTKNGSSAVAYVNGSQVTTATVSSPKTSGDAVTRFFDYYSSGLMEIQMCRIYNRVLSSQEILVNYNAYSNIM
jgi:hypothetical protein